MQESFVNVQLDNFKVPSICSKRYDETATIAQIQRANYRNINYGSHA